jgi:hypothetical protein
VERVFPHGARLANDAATVRGAARPA